MGVREACILLFQLVRNVRKVGVREACILLFQLVRNVRKVGETRWV